MVFNYIKESEMESKEKIASFIEYHNIIRPIEYPLFAVPFLSIIMSVLYLIGCFSEYKYSTAREICLLVAILFIMLLISVLICATVWIIKYRINKGIYLNKKRIDFNKVAIFSSTSFISVVFIIKSIVLNNLDSNMPVLILLMLINCMVLSVILSTAYYLKLKYAKEYGLEKYLPRRPNPSKYTGWK